MQITWSNSDSFRSCSILVSVVPVISDSCSGGSGGFVPVVSFRWFRWFRSGGSGGFVPVVSGFSTCLNPG